MRTLDHICCQLAQNKTYPKSQTPIDRNTDTLYNSWLPFRRDFVVPCTMGTGGAGAARSVSLEYLSAFPFDSPLSLLTAYGGGDGGGDGSAG